MSEFTAKIEYVVGIQGAEETKLIMETTTSQIQQLAAIGTEKAATVTKEIETMQQRIKEMPEAPTEIDIAEAEEMLDKLKQRLEELPETVTIDTAEAEQKLATLKQQIIEGVPQAEIKSNVEEVKREFSEAAASIKDASEEVEKLEQPLDEARRSVEELDSSIAVSVGNVQDFMGEVQLGIGFISRLDYTWLAWERAAHQFDLRSFLSMTLSTISTIQTIIRLTKQAEVAQIAYNAALAIGQALTPWGWAAILASTAVGLGYGATQIRYPIKAEPYVFETEAERESRERRKEIEDLLRQRQKLRREEYRATEPG